MLSNRVSQWPTDLKEARSGRWSFLKKIDNNTAVYCKPTSGMSLKVRFTNNQFKATDYNFVMVPFRKPFGG